MNKVQKQRRPRPWMYRGASLILACLLANVIAAADRPTKPMRETATLPTDKNVLKRFGAIEDYLAEKRWVEAIDVLQEISQTDSRLLVLTQPGVGGESAVYLNVATRCNILLSQLPAEGLAAYRKKVDPQARRWLDHWKQTHDEADLQRVIREAYLSSFGDEALWALGESAWDRGDIASARLYWTQLVPLAQDAPAANLPTILRYPDSDLNRAEVLARLVLCTVMDDERVRATAELQRFKELFPNAQGSLAGRQGRLVDLVQQILEESAQWDPLTDPSNASTFGLNVGRDGALPARIELGASRWVHPLPSNRLPHPDRFNPAPDPPLSYHPVTYGDIVLVNNSRSIWAWNLVTGEPAWPTERGTAEIYPPAPDDVTGLPNQASSGVPYYTMTVADGRLYARMGSPVTNPVDNPAEADLESDLICLDLAGGQGKIVWKIAAHELIKEDHKPWRFEGSPLVMGGRTYVALSRRRPQFEFTIACLDAATGTLLWNRPVGSSRGAVEEHQNRVSHLLLTAGAGKLFLSTDAGAVVAVNARDGRLDWAVTYESIPSTRPSSHLHQGLLPAMFHDGLVFVVPNDSNRLFCIEADSGRVRWQIKQPKQERWRHLLGVVRGGDRGRLIVSGDTLWSIDIATNKMVFGSRANWLGNRAPAAEQGYGRGVIAHNVILWPTRESLKVVDSQTGATLENKPLLTGGSAEIGGNLTVSQGMLLVAQPMRLVAYCEYSLLKKRLERELSERMNSDDHRTPLIATPVESGKRTRQMSTESLFGQLADVELAEGNVETAVETLQRAIETMESTGELDKATMVRFENLSLELLRKEGRKALSEGDAALALTRLRKARQRASEPGDVVAILLDMANAELALNRPVAAVELWQQILDDSRLRDVSMRDSTAATEVAKDISLLIEKRGPAAYSAIEQRAAHEISMLLKANDLEGLHRVLPKYPNAEVSGQAWRQLATLDRQAGRFASALDIQTRQLDPTGSHKTLANLLVDRAETLQAAGYWRPARTIWKRLGTEQFSNHDIESGGESQRVGELARVRLQNPEYKVYEPAEQPVARYLDREWSIDLSSTGGLSDAPLEGIPRQDDVAVLVPRNDPPALNLACVLVPRQDTTIGAGLRWECLDRATGQVRWSRSLTAAPQWSAYAESHLLLATDTNLTAISLETGRDIWSTPLTKPVESVGRLVMGEGGPAQVAERTARPSKPVSTVKICIRDDAVFTFDSRTGAAAVDGRTGQVLWSFSPPRGKLQQQWSCGSRRIALQTVQPAITWSIDIATGRVSERPGATEPWLQGPVVDDDDAMVFVSADRRIESRSNANGRSLWRYRGGMSFAHVDPVLWSDGSQLLLSIDGTTLASVNRTTGTPNWSTGLADRPLKTPASQVITHGDAAFAASHGLLRRISLKYGDCQWERFLGTATDQWRVCACGELIAAWPVESKTEINSSGPRQIVVWCDARTGRIIQRMSIANEERMINVTGDERGCLVQTDRSLIAFRAAGDRPDVVSAVR